MTVIPFEFQETHSSASSPGISSPPIRAVERDAFPPCNIEKLGHQDFRITLDVGGYEADDIQVSMDDGLLIVVGNAPQLRGNAELLHKEIASAFQREFEINIPMEIESVRWERGLLKIDLVSFSLDGLENWLRSPLPEEVDARAAS